MRTKAPTIQLVDIPLAGTQPEARLADAPELARPLVDPAMKARHERLCPRSDCWWG